jgi:hypothetical protein
MRQLFGALLLAGCWTGAAVAPPPPSAPDELPDPPAPFEGVAGRWEGIGRQYADEVDWEIVVRLHARAAIGEPIGAIAYPSLGCSGLLIRTRERAGTYTVQERLLENPEDRCIDGGTIQLRRRAAGLDWRWFDADGNEAVASVLTRAR